MKKILVIGGTGFLGHHICKRLVKRKIFLVHSLSLNKPTQKKKLKKIKYYKQNLLEKIFKINLRNKNYDFIINASGYSGNLPSYSNNKNINAKHFTIIKNILNNINTKKAVKLIHLGSSSEYGEKKSPLKETLKCKPKNMYGKSKLACTKYILNFKDKNFKYVILRLFQVYGAFQMKDKLIPYIIEKCKKDLEFNVSSGNQIRDYLHVDDLAIAIEKAITIKKAENKIINLGSGNLISVKKIIKIICNIIKKGKPNYGALKINPGESLKIYPNIHKAKSHLNWSSKIKFKNGIKQIIQNQN
jgi:nucleoside-diphosphate-sugar epimerase